MIRYSLRNEVLEIYFVEKFLKNKLKMLREFIDTKALTLKQKMRKEPLVNNILHT